MPKEITINQINKLKTKSGERFRCSFVKLSKMDPEQITLMKGKVGNNPSTYWWNRYGQCTVLKCSHPEAIRKPDYDLDYSQI